MKYPLNFFGALGIISLFIIVSFLLVRWQKNEHTPVRIAKSISAECKTTQSDSCYVNRFAQLAKQNDVSYTLQVLSELEKRDSSIVGCHFIAHVIAGQEVSKDPEHWQKALSRLPITDCTGGYLMGVMEGRSKYEKNFRVNADTVQQLCEQVEQSARGNDVDMTCFHIMGHLMLLETKGNLSSAIKICQSLTEEYQYECFAGVFMEHEYKRNLAAHGVGKATTWKKAMLNEQKAICNEYQGEAAKACWRELSHMFVFFSNNYPPDVYTACNQAPSAASREDCYVHAVGIMAASLKFDRNEFGLLCKPYNNNDLSYTRCVKMVVNTLQQSSATKVLPIFCSSIPEKYASHCQK